MAVTLKALKPLTYAGKRIPLGQEFQARGESDARVLCAVGNATRTTEAPAYDTRMMTAQAPQSGPRSFASVAMLEKAPPSYGDQVVTQPAWRTGGPGFDVPEVDPSSYTPDSKPIPAHVESVTSDLDGMDRDALYAMAVSLGMKPHHLMGAVKLRAAIAEHRAAQ